MANYKERNVDALFALVRSGLWPDNQRQLSSAVFQDSVDWDEVYRIASEQSVMGLVLAGIEHFKNKVPGFKIPQTILLQWIGEVQAIEQQNKAMNDFIGSMMRKLRDQQIDAVLIKGQGVAQCYEKPLWRSAGDVDLLLDDNNYEKGKKYLVNISETEPEEYSFNKEYSTTIKGWNFELHGSLRSGLSKSFNRGVDMIQSNICERHDVRYWSINGDKIALPEENNDVLVIFTHYIKHFYKGGLGIRQICDWCRLLWTFRDTIDVVFLEKNLKLLNLMPEWKAFAAYAVEYLGMPQMAMPLYVDAKKWNKKANKIQAFLIEVGNFGHNIDGSYYSNYPYLIRKTYSMFRRVGALGRHACIFPFQVVRYLPHVVFMGLKTAIKGE